jgi:hypothetical protein
MPRLPEKWIFKFHLCAGKYACWYPTAAAPDYPQELASAETGHLKVVLHLYDHGLTNSAALFYFQQVNGERCSSALQCWKFRNSLIS